MLTFIGKYDLTCITKEEADRLAQGVEHPIDSNNIRFKLKIDDGSIGDDLEEMIDDIKRREFIWRNGVGCYNKWYSGNKSSKNLNFFHISPLTKEEQRKLESKDSTFKRQFANGIPDFPKPQKLEFKSQTKYRLSICPRRTFLITNCEPTCKSFSDRTCNSKECKACRCIKGCTKQINFY